MTLHLIRHGEAEGNLERRFIGQGDVPLSERGRRQAERVAARLAGSGIVRVVASDLRRAADTAGPLAALLGVPVDTDPSLREVHNGRWTGLLADEVAEGWPDMFADYVGGADVPRPDGERWADVAARVLPTIEDLLADGRPTAVFTHGGPVLCVAAWASGLTVSGNVFAGPFTAPDNAAVSRVVAGPRLAAYNDTGHLTGV